MQCLLRRGAVTHAEGDVQVGQCHLRPSNANVVLQHQQDYTTESGVVDHPIIITRCSSSAGCSICGCSKLLSLSLLCHPRLVLHVFGHLAPERVHQMLGVAGMIIHENVRTQLTQGGGHLDEGGARHGLVPLVVVLKQASSAACGLNNETNAHYYDIIADHIRSLVRIIS